MGLNKYGVADFKLGICAEKFVILFFPVCNASGGVRLETIGEIAATGVDVISVGALTHSARSLDLGLDVRLD